MPAIPLSKYILRLDGEDMVAEKSEPSLESIIYAWLKRLPPHL